MSWGNPQNSTEDQHMEAPQGFHLKVTNANENDAALYSKNSSAEANARALKIEGTAEFLGRVAGGDALLRIRNCSITNSDNGNGLMLQPGQGNQFVVISPGATVLMVAGNLSAADAQFTGNARVNGNEQVDGSLDIQGDIMVAAPMEARSIHSRSPQTSATYCLGLMRSIRVMFSSRVPIRRLAFKVVLSSMGQLLSTAMRLSMERLLLSRTALWRGAERMTCVSELQVLTPIH